MTAVERVPLLDVDSVSVHFPVGARIFGRPRDTVRAVDGVSLTVERGSILGLVGESGCGKSTLARTLIGLRSATAGSVRFDGVDITTVKRRALRQMRKRMQIVFQDPYASLNPRMTIHSTLAEPIVEHALRSGSRAVDQRVDELLGLVGLRKNMAHRFPHEFSGGQRQRVAIARALAVEPELIVCDEPISALDVSIQAQILNLLLELRGEFDLTYVFVAHDLAVVRRVCTDVAVMYLGRVVEQGKRDDIYDSPQHPYTIALLAAVPTMRKSKTTTRERIVLTGDLPSAADKIDGCAFASRCWLYKQLGEPEKCRTTRPELEAVGATQSAACHFPGEAARLAGSAKAP